MNQDELEELIEEHELEVDLDEHKTLRKKRAAVVDAAEEAGILAED
jgi:phage portal protein BeeE